MSTEMRNLWAPPPTGEETGAGAAQFGWVPAPPEAYVPHNQLLHQQQVAAYHQQLYHQHQMHLQEYQQQQQQVVPVH